MLRHQPLGETSHISVGTVPVVLVGLDAAHEAILSNRHATTHQVSTHGTHINGTMLWLQ